MNENVLNEDRQLTTTEQTYFWKVGPIEFTFNSICEINSQIFEFDIDCANGDLNVEYRNIVRHSDSERGVRLDTRLDLLSQDDVVETLSFITQAIEMVHKIENNQISQLAGIDILKNLSIQFVQSLDQDFDSPNHDDCEY